MRPRSCGVSLAIVGAGKDAERLPLAVALQAQGLSEDASRFAYRAQVLQREVYRRDGETARRGEQGNCRANQERCSTKICGHGHWGRSQRFLNSDRVRTLVAMGVAAIVSGF